MLPYLDEMDAREQELITMIAMHLRRRVENKIKYRFIRGMMLFQLGDSGVDQFAIFRFQADQIAIIVH